MAAETVRAPDGLALSSRNRYLSEAQRREAPRLQQVLSRVKEAVENGDRNFEAIEFAADAELARHGWHVDYVVVRSRRTLMQPDAGRARAGHARCSQARRDTADRQPRDRRALRPDGRCTRT